MAATHLLTVQVQGHTFSPMRARWASFAVGMWLLHAPLVLGHASIVAVLHDVALGLLLCVVALASMEWPLARFGLVLPAVALLSGELLGFTHGLAGANDAAVGAATLGLSLVPGGKLAPERAPAKMAA